MRILLPPGLGDQHWVMTKMQSFIKKELKGEVPTVYIWGSGPTASRSIDYLKRLPFIEYGGLYEGGKGLLARAYQKGTPPAIRAFQAGEERFDWFLQFNGQLEQGEPLEGILPGLETNWHYPLELTEEDAALAGRISTSRGKFFLMSFFGHGHYRSLSLRDFPVGHIATTIVTMRNTFDRAEVILTGAEWDKPLANEIASMCPGEVINQAGRTSLPALLALIRQCSGWVGFPAGNGIMATYYRKPTVLLWDAYFEKEFRTCWAEPSAPYIALDTKKTRPEEVIAAMRKLVK